MTTMRFLQHLHALMVVGVVVLTGCTSTATINDADVNEDKLYGSYSADFDANSSTLTLYAQFRVGGSSGTTVRLQPPSSLTVDGEPMKMVDGDSIPLNVTGTYYLVEKKVQEAGGMHTFVWTRRDGSAHTNTLAIGELSSTWITPSKEVLSRSFSITSITSTAVDGAGVESVTCTLKSTNKDGDPAEATELIKSVPSGGEGCAFTATDLTKFRLGPATVTWERSRLTSPQQGHESVGGSLRSKVKSKATPVTIVP